MKPAAKFILGCLLLVSLAQAEVTSVPEFDTLMRKYGDDVQLSAGAIYEAGVSELKLKYTAAIERALKTAQDAGKLEEALAFKNEIKLIAEGGDLAADDTSLRPELQKLRAIYRQSLARLERDKNNVVNPLITALNTSLEQLIVTLTKSGRLDEALFVKQKKDKLGEESAKAVKQAAAAVAANKGVLTNSLGMKFVPVPGINVLFCIHETRRQDYAAYAAATPGLDNAWMRQARNGVPVGDKDDHPVAGISLDDANGFCAWLSQKEGKTYRVPTDREWSVAVGLGEQEKDRKDQLPTQLSAKVEGVFPWEGDYPPKATSRDGNYADTAAHEALAKQPWIEGFTDGFATTAPVMSFKPNQFGIYDLGGNLFEWCSDLFDAKSNGHVLRGAAWNEQQPGMLLSSRRVYNAANARQTFYGFRVVLEIEP